MSAPTLAQQRGLAYAPLPFAAIGSISCLCVIHHLLRKKPEKLNRLYHRLVLTMNVSLLASSLTWIWGPFAVPEGTDDFAGAAGTVETCTASGFLAIALSLSVPFYYVSLILQAFLAIRNNFKEENYKWIEKWVHIVAIVFPIAIASVFAATENINPNASACYVAKAPRGCNADPNVTCERGEDIKGFENSVEYSLLILYFIVPLVMITSICCWVRKFRKKIEESTGWQKVMGFAREEMARSVHNQILLYLFCFWFTWVFNFAHHIYKLITKEYLYNLLIFGNCINRFQGFVFAIVYFILSKMNKPKTYYLPKPKTDGTNQVTVGDIRSSAERSSAHDPEEDMEKEKELEISFNIFDGVPDENSPWAKFIDEDDDDDDDDVFSQNQAIP